MSPFELAPVFFLQLSLLLLALSLFFIPAVSGLEHTTKTSRLFLLCVNLRKTICGIRGKKYPADGAERVPQMPQISQPFFPSMAGAFVPAVLLPSRTQR